jgi:hypothetical protein
MPQSVRFGTAVLSPVPDTQLEFSKEKHEKVQIVGGHARAPSGFWPDVRGRTRRHLMSLAAFAAGGERSAD